MSAFPFKAGGSSEEDEEAADAAEAAVAAVPAVVESSETERYRLEVYPLPCHTGLKSERCNPRSFHTITVACCFETHV